MFKCFLLFVFIILLCPVFAMADTTAAVALPSWVTHVFAIVGGLLAAGSALGLKNSGFLARAAKEVQDSHDFVNGAILLIKDTRDIVAKSTPQEISDFNATINALVAMAVDSGSGSLIAKARSLQALLIKGEAEVNKLTGAPAAPTA